MLLNLIKGELCENVNFNLNVKPEIFYVSITDIPVGLFRKPFHEYSDDQNLIQ